MTYSNCKSCVIKFLPGQRLPLIWLLLDCGAIHEVSLEERAASPLGQMFFKFVSLLRTCFLYILL